MSAIQQVFANQDTRQLILKHYYNLRALDQYMNEFQQGQLFKLKFEVLDKSFHFFDVWSVRLLRNFKELIYEYNPACKKAKNKYVWEKHLNECEIIMEYKVYHNYAILDNFSGDCNCYKLYIWGIVGKSKYGKSEQTYKLTENRMFPKNPLIDITLRRQIADCYQMYSDSELCLDLLILCGFRNFMNIRANHEDINRMYPSRRFKKDFSSIYGGIEKHNQTHTKTAMKLLEEYEDREDYECSNYKGLEIYKRYLRDFICDDVLTT